MGSYTVTLSDEQEDAVSYALEKIAAEAVGQDPPWTLPTRQQYVEQAARGGLAVPLSSLQSAAELALKGLRPLDAATRALVLAGLGSPALTAYVERHLAAAG